MKVLNLGSLNVDKIYDVDHIAKAGETILSKQHAVFYGGKGLNQSVALAKANATVYHAGYVGNDGDALIAVLAEAGVDTSFIRKIDDVSGHAIIQIDKSGQNSIIVHGGANQLVDETYIDDVLSQFDAGDLLLLQNEVANVAYAIRSAKDKGMLVALNPSPITQELQNYPIAMIDYLILNEVEGCALAGIAEDDCIESINYNNVISAVADKYPGVAIVLTIGKKGVLYQSSKTATDEDMANITLHHQAYIVEAVDTTAAGDTFCGYFLASITRGLPVAKALEYASKASAITVSTKGASNSIPLLENVMKFEGNIFLGV